MSAPLFTEQLVVEYCMHAMKVAGSLEALFECNYYLDALDLLTELRARTLELESIYNEALDKALTDMGDSPE